MTYVKWVFRSRCMYVVLIFVGGIYICICHNITKLRTLRDDCFLIMGYVNALQNIFITIMYNYLERTIYDMS